MGFSFYTVIQQTGYPNTLSYNALV